MKNNELRKARALMLKAKESGYSNTSLARLYGTSASRVKLMLARALSEADE